MAEKVPRTFGFTRLVSDLIRVHWCSFVVYKVPPAKCQVQVERNRN